MKGARNAPPATTSFKIIGQASTLVVRAWLEPVAGGEPILRGTIRELGGQMLGSFDSIETLSRLVESHMAHRAD